MLKDLPLSPQHSSSCFLSFLGLGCQQRTRKNIGLTIEQHLLRKMWTPCVLLSLNSPQKCPKPMLMAITSARMMHLFRPLLNWRLCCSSLVGSGSGSAGGPASGSELDTPRFLGRRLRTVGLDWLLVSSLLDSSGLA